MVGRRLRLLRVAAVGITLVLLATAGGALAASGPDPGWSSVSGGSSTVVADGVSMVTIIVVVRDSSGNPVSNVPVNVVASPAAGVGGTFSTNTASDGSAALSLTSTKAEAKLFSVSSGSIELGEVPVTFVAGAAV